MNACICMHPLELFVLNYDHGRFELLLSFLRSTLFCVKRGFHIYVAQVVISALIIGINTNKLSVCLFCQWWAGHHTSCNHLIISYLLPNFRSKATRIDHELTSFIPLLQILFVFFVHVPQMQIQIQYFVEYFLVSL